ncbi:hypothetical protein HLA97_04520 [Gordonia araii NBRC 100433]|nr:hypothetical protein [Gordonia araii]NNG96517.1 hypothetical protein [Gordonia araii NBRC 100433]
MTSATIALPTDITARTPPGHRLAFGAAALLPAATFHQQSGQPALAAYAVTGVRRAGTLPDSRVNDGAGYFVYVTVMSLADRPAPAPDIIGLAGSVDGRTPALTIRATGESPGCETRTPPRTMKRGESYATCLLAVVDKGQQVRAVVYWANTGSDPAFDYKSRPVAWTADGRPPSSPPPAG